MKPSVVLFFCLVSSLLFAADLTITSQSNRTYDGGTYNHLSISNSQNITVKNCTFSTNSGNVVNIQNSTSITVEGCDINGLVDACTGVNIGGNANGVTIQDCDIHDIADDGFQIVGADNIHLLGNTVCRLYGCGTDGGCGGLCVPPCPHRRAPRRTPGVGSCSRRIRRARGPAVPQSVVGPVVRDRARAGAA